MKRLNQRWRSAAVFFVALCLVFPGVSEAWEMETVLEMNKLNQEIAEIKFAVSLADAHEKISAEFAISVAAKPGKDKICATDQLAECFRQRLLQSEYSQIRSHGILTLKDLERAYTAFDSLYPKDAEVEIKDREKRLATLKSKDKFLIAHLVSAFKRVELRSAGLGEFSAIGKGHKLYLNEELRTGPRGRARIEFEDRNPDLNAGPSVVNIGSGTQVQMVKFQLQMRSEKSMDRNGIINLIKGTIRSFTKNWGASSAFSVRTGTSLCGIRGTDIEISYDPDADRVVYRLYKGIVTITTPYEEFEMEPMHTVTVTRGEAGETRKIVGPRPAIDALLPTFVEPPPV